MNKSSKVIWAKLRYCPYWPAQLVTNPPTCLKIPPRKCCVQFFGTNNYGFVEAENIQSYIPNREKFKKRGRGKAFANAVTECENYITDCSNTNSKDDCMSVEQVVIKKELNSNVKQENPEDIDFFSREAIYVCSSCEVKSNEINSLKVENKQITSSFIDIQKKNSNLEIRNEQNEIQIDELNKQNGQLKTELLQNTSEIQHLTNANEQSKNNFGELKNENEKLRIEMNKYKCMAAHSKQNDEMMLKLTRENISLKSEIQKLKAEPENEYEVESLIGHKWEKGVQFFLVRWKGFDCSHDTWEQRNSLNCPRILKIYLKRNNIT